HFLAAAHSRRRHVAAVRAADDDRDGPDPARENGLRHQPVQSDAVRRRTHRHPPPRHAAGAPQPADVLGARRQRHSLQSGRAVDDLPAAGRVHGRRRRHGDGHAARLRRGLRLRLAAGDDGRVRRHLSADGCHLHRPRAARAVDAAAQAGRRSRRSALNGGRSVSAMPRAQGRREVAGVSLSHPDRVLFPAAGVTKLGLAKYYEAIADWILPHLVDRPLTLVRCPNGVPAGGARKGVDCIYMKHAKVWGPAPIRRERIREKTKVGEYLIVDTLRALIGLVQIDVLEVHTWNSRCAHVEQPERIVVDLDPGADVGWPAVVEASKLVRQLLGVLDLASFVKTTGGRGAHVVVPIAPRASWDECLAFARAFAQALVRKRPELFTERFAKVGRDDKILVDYLRNNRTNTSIAAFSTRAKPDAPVSVPLAWSELSAARTPDRFTIHTVPKRLGKLTADPWKDYWKS